MNITRIKAVSNALGLLKEQVVFVGGATVSLYADREVATEVRPTDDIDILVEITSRYEFAILEDQLRQMGFQNDSTSAFLGRFTLQGLIVDVMPTEESILGFSNIWYKKGFSEAVSYRIDDLHTVKIFPVGYFIASKLEAFKSRGKNDGRTSTDFEDIVFVLENRRTVWEELQTAGEPLNSYLKSEFKMLTENKYIEEWISSNLSPASSIQASQILKNMKALG